jgi:hypothetical protein
LNCDGNGDFDASGDSGDLACSPNICNGDVSNGFVDGDYTSCTSFTTTGGTCVPVCEDGYSTAGSSDGFTLVCDTDGNYDAAADTGDLVCTINVCDGIAINTVTNADYSACGFESTGATCTPVCQSGHATTGSSPGFTLLCEDNGNYNAGVDSGDLQCSVNSCGGNVSNGVAAADYSACQTATTTGGSCTPVCPVDYTTTGASDGFELVCEDNGDFDAAADTGDLVCTVNDCDGIVTNGVANADYSACAAVTSGNSCTPVCKAGYAANGASNGFTLRCDDDGGFDAAGDTGNLECAPNICDGDVSNGVNHGDYSSCTVFTTTGGTCVPVCEDGFTTSGSSDSFELICDENGDYDAAADTGDLVCTLN